jgi:uncharacterized protein DUF4386
MSDPELRRWTGAFGAASGALLLVLLVLYFFVGTSPRAEDVAKFTAYVSMHNSLLLTITLLYTLSGACFLVFLAGFRHLIRESKPDFGSVSVLVFAAGVVNTTVGLVGLNFIAGAALDTVNHKPDPSVVSALGEASTPAVGAVGLIMLALFLASAGYATMGTGVLPRWTGWVAYAAATISLVSVPSIYAGSGPTDFYTADGYVVELGVLFYLIWLLIAGISLLVLKPQTAR